MTQLIVFRALQGIGGSGMYALVMIVMFETYPEPQWPKYTGIIGGLFTVSLLLGPLLGGLINIRTTWRWVFFLK